MELTPEQALQKAIEAYRAGEIDKSKHYYNTVLKTDPKNPDANHNMGILAVSTGDLKNAISFFEIALDANPYNVQFWVTYIDILIKHGQMDHANVVYNTAKKRFTKSGSLKKLEHRLKVSRSSTLASLTSDSVSAKYYQALNLYKKGLMKETVAYCQTLLMQFPKSIKLWNLLGAASIQSGDLELAVRAFREIISIQPKSADAYNNMGIAYKQQGKLEDAKAAFSKAVSLKPDYPEVLNNLGVIQHDEGNSKQALENYKKALFFKPNYTEAYINLGNALKSQKKFSEAIEAYNKALSLEPSSVEIYINLGICLRMHGMLEKAVNILKKALSLKPNNADIYYNIGMTLQQSGKLEAALAAYEKAVSIKPDYAAAFNNMGNNLQKQAKIVDAKKAFSKAIKIQPDYADVYWNLTSTAQSITEAKDYLLKCLRIEPNHLKARFTISAFEFYEGNTTPFMELRRSSYKSHPYIRSFNWVFNLPELPPLYFNRWDLFDRVIEISRHERPFYEFGVWRGEAFKYLIKTFGKGYGFDTFVGLPEDWHKEKTGTYTSEGNIPRIEGGEFIVGKFEESLPKFFAEKRPKASLINFDADLYSSTICALNFAQAIIDKHTILIFDEFLINNSWEQDEYKALEEFCSKNDYNYQVVAISFFTKQVAVKIVKKNTVINNPT